MRRALTYLVVAAALCTQGIAAEHKTWNRIRYVGGTIPVKASPYDWNTTLTVTANPDMIILSIAPSSVFAHKQTVRIQPSQVSSLLNGSGAWERVAGERSSTPSQAADAFWPASGPLFLWNSVSDRRRKERRHPSG